MSNILAVATVSGVLAARMQTMLDDAGLSGFGVTLTHPDADSTPGIFLHLYRIQPNADLRNQRLPERRSDASVVCPPRLAIDLDFLFSFVGEDSSHDAERLAGLVMTGLNERPGLTSGEINDFMGTLTSGHVLLGANLAEQIEGIRITPLSMDLEELSRLWGMLGQTVHRLSVAYRVSVVMLDAEVEHGTALPVVTPSLTTFQLRAPRLTGVSSSERDIAVVRFGEEIVLTGQALRGTSTLLRFSDLLLPVTDPADDEIRQPFDLASGLGLGVLPVQVVHEVVLEDGTTREAAESNALPVALVPTVAMAAPNATAVVGGFEVRLTVNPVPDVEQQTELLLVGTSGEGRSTWADWALDAGAMVFTTGPLAAGSYLVRLEIDGAVSLLETDPVTLEFTGPVVTVS